MSPFGAYFVAHFVSHIPSSHISSSLVRIWNMLASSRRTECTIKHVYLLSYIYSYSLGLDGRTSTPRGMPSPSNDTLGLASHHGSLVWSWSVQGDILCRTLSQPERGKTSKSWARVITMFTSSHTAFLPLQPYMTFSNPNCHFRGIYIAVREHTSMITVTILWSV